MSLPPSRWFRRIPLAAISGCMLSLLAPSPAAAGEKEPAVLRRDTPYAPLMAVVGGGELGPFSDEQLRQIGSTWRMVNSHGGMLPHDDITQPPSAYWAGPSAGRDAQGRTIGERLKALAPDFILSNYRNGSYIAQFSPWEAEEVERRFPTAISVWNTGCTLLAGVAPGDTQVSLTRFPADKVPAKPEIKGGRPDHYPFKASTAAGEYSRTTKEYVGWLRLGDELLRIERLEVAGDRLNLTVRRGLWGTTAAAHAAGAPVLQPVYIGRNMGIDAGDGALGGRLDDPSRQPGVRYALMTFDPRMHAWLGDKAERIFAEGYDVCWLDVSVSTWYNNANAFGDEVRPWNVRTGQLLTQEDYRGWQQEKNDSLYRRFPGKRFWINNVKGGVYFTNGRDRLQLSGENDHHPVDGGSMEMYANHRGNAGAWVQTADMTLDMVRSGFHAVAWSKGRNDSDYRRFSYATYLLAYEPGAELYFAIGEGGSLLKRPADLYYYELGEPQQRFQRIAEAELPDAKGVYSRQFARARVLVNPGKDAARVTLAEEYLDAVTLQPVREVALEGNQAAILLRPPAAR
jgi:hypothetical protein